MKRNLSQILSMESFSDIDKSAVKKLNINRKKNYQIAQEGLFDFFRKKKGEEVKQKPENINDHLTELQQANRVSIHLMTTSVDSEIKYLEELVSKGLPFMSKDIDRMNKSFKFVIDNHKDILSKIDQLVDISYPDSSYKLTKDLAAVEFTTFYIAVKNMAKDKEHQAMIGSGWDYYDVVDEFDEELSEEQIKQYSKLYCLDEAIPTLDFIYPKDRANKNQTRVYLEKDDPKLQTLLKLNIDLINKARSVLSNQDMDKFYALAGKADKLTHPKQIGDGDEYGLFNLLLHGLGYQYDLTNGFAKTFIDNYTAH